MVSPRSGMIRTPPGSAKSTPGRLDKLPVKPDDKNNQVLPVLILVVKVL